MNPYAPTSGDMAPSDTRDGPAPGAPAADSAFLAEPLEAWLEARGAQGEQTSGALRQYLFIAEGSAVGRFRDGEIAIPTGAVLMAPPGIRWSAQVAPGSRGMWLATTEGFLVSTLMPALGFLPPQTWEGLMAPTVFGGMTGAAAADLRAATLTELLKARARLFISQAAVATYMVVVLTSGMIDSDADQRAPGAVAGPIGDPGARLMLNFRELVEQHLDQRLSIAEYAQRLGVSVDRLNRVCRGVGGATPLSIVTARIMQEAKVELLYSDDPVALIGYRLGFPDPAYFSRFFKRYTSYAPSEYRAAFSSAQDERGPPVLKLSITRIGAVRRVSAV
jgi:AraC family transcriptional activator of pobA